MAQLPPGAAQPRVRAVASSVEALLAQTAGVKGWVTIGGYAALDSAKLSNVVTMFVMYEDLGKRPEGFSQAGLIAELQEKLRSVPVATFAVALPADRDDIDCLPSQRRAVADRRRSRLGESASAGYGGLRWHVGVDTAGDSVRAGLLCGAPPLPCGTGYGSVVRGPWSIVCGRRRAANRCAACSCPATAILLAS